MENNGKRIFIVHGWDGYPELGWFPWLKKELENRGFEVYVPQLPDAGTPRIEKWVPKLAEVAGSADENTYFVGHSMGCQTIARFLEALPEGVRVGGVVFVAGFFKRLMDIEDEETMDHWLSAPIDLERVRSHIESSVALFSDDDPWVSLDNQDDFRDKLGSKIVVEHEMGHFHEGYEKRTLPIVLRELLEIVEH